jgi:hypothetical protein
VSEDVAIAQIVTAITTVFYAGVFAIGYYLLIKGNRETLREMREQRISGGRPQVIVQARYDRLPMVDLVVRNFGGGVAKDITFSFSDPLEDSSGFVLSELAYFQEGMSFLGPGEEVACAWDNLDALTSSLRKKGRKRGTLVKVSYEDLAGEVYETEWRINPLIYEGNRHVPSQHHQAVQAFVSAPTQVSEKEAGHRHSRGTVMQIPLKNTLADSRRVLGQR